MILARGTKLGPYEVLEPIGAGGMGEVYRARDTSLGRDVALKVLPEGFARNSDRIARFKREAQVLASLNHPNIAAIYGLEDSNGIRALVMELVEGPTLSERISNGPIPVDEALPIARQIAEALEGAHEQGIIHRDLKPANVKLRPDGVVKVLDFGLAKASQAAVVRGDMTDLPTITSPAVTEMGVILGTPAYMAPEQARGEQVDKRIDIWAFGVVLYEMLAGHRVFQGKTVSDTLAAVMRDTPDLRRVPAKVRPLLARCLEKDPKRRLHDIGDAMPLVDQPPEPVPTPRPWIAWSSCAIAVAGAIGLVLLRQEPAAPNPARFEIPLPENVMFDQVAGFSVSPDGRRLAFGGKGADRVTRIWVRDLNSLETQPLSGSEGPISGLLFWSADSRFVIFSVARSLTRIDSSSHSVVTLAKVPGNVPGGATNRDGVIIMGNTAGGVLRVPMEGGKPQPVTVLDASRKEVFHLFPFFFPDGRHFLYSHITSTSVAGGLGAIGIGSLDVQPEKQSGQRLAVPSVQAVYVPPARGNLGKLLFVREETLMAQPFDAGRLQLSGKASPLVRPVGTYLAQFFFSASANVLVYRKPGAADFQLTWFDREGRVMGKAGKPAPYLSTVLSHDGTRAALTISAKRGPQRWNLWLLDFARDSTMPLTHRPGQDLSPVWAPRGDRIIFGGNDESSGLYQKAVNSSIDVERLVESSGQPTLPSNWSRDSRFVLYTQTSPAGNDLWLLPLQGDRKARPLLNTSFNESGGVFSPDGKWIAYASDESGRNEVYVCSFPDLRGRVMISSGGGSEPRWLDSKQVVYVGGDGRVMSVEVTAGPAFHAGAPRALFRPPLGFGPWDVTADGKRFLLAIPVEQSARAPFAVMLDWQSELK